MTLEKSDFFIQQSTHMLCFCDDVCIFLEDWVWKSVGKALHSSSIETSRNLITSVFTDILLDFHIKGLCGWVSTKPSSWYNSFIYIKGLSQSSNRFEVWLISLKGTYLNDELNNLPVTVHKALFQCPNQWWNHCQAFIIPDGLH